MSAPSARYQTRGKQHKVCLIHFGIVFVKPRRSGWSLWHEFRCAKGILNQVMILPFYLEGRRTTTTIPKNQKNHSLYTIFIQKSCFCKSNCVNYQQLSIPNPLDGLADWKRPLPPGSPKFGLTLFHPPSPSARNRCQFSEVETFSFKPWEQSGVSFPATTLPPLPPELPP